LALITGIVFCACKKYVLNKEKRKVIVFMPVFFFAGQNDHAGPA